MGNKNSNLQNAKKIKNDEFYTRYEDIETKYLRILNSSYHNLQIITDQQLLSRAENIFSLNSKN